MFTSNDSKNRPIRVSNVRQLETGGVNPFASLVLERGCPSSLIGVAASCRETRSSLGPVLTTHHDFLTLATFIYGCLLSPFTKAVMLIGTSS